MKLSPEIRDGYLSMIQGINPDIAITLKTRPGLEVTPESMLVNLRLFDAIVASEALPRNWSSQPHDKRIQGVFVLEYGKSRVYPHWHGLVRTPDGDPERYRHLIKSAGNDVGWSVWTDTDQGTLSKYAAKAEYLLKELNDDTTDRLVFTNMLRGSESPL